MWQYSTDKKNWYKCCEDDVILALVELFPTTAFSYLVQMQKDSSVIVSTATLYFRYV